MNMRRRFLVAVLLLGLMAALGGKAAEAKYLASQVTVDGPILHNPVVVDGEAEINDLIGGFFVVPSENLVAQVRPGHLFLLTVYTQAEDGSQAPVDRVVVSLDASGQSAQLYRLGMVNGWATQDGHWYEADPTAVSLLTTTLRQGGVDFDPEGAILGLPPLSAAQGTSESPSPWWRLMGVLLAGFGFLAGWWADSIRHRRRAEEPSGGEPAG